MKKIFLIALISIVAYACGNQNGTPPKESEKEEATSAGSTENPSYDPNRGEGKFTAADIGAKPDAALAANGEKVYGVKCSGCHKITDEKLVGPGWKGVTQRHKPEWILNFITNTDEMLNKDPKAQAQLEICLVRMPNQNLSDDEAKQLLDFMRKNDGAK